MDKLSREVQYLTNVVKVLGKENKDLKEQLEAAQYAVQDLLSYAREGGE
jgi:chaperonin cofactor prefoldin